MSAHNQTQAQMFAWKVEYIASLVTVVKIIKFQTYELFIQIHIHTNTIGTCA